GAGSFVRIGVVPPNSTSFTDTTVSAATGYTYRVRATNDFFASPWTDESNITTKQPPPAAPTSLIAGARATVVTLSWVDQSSSEPVFEIWRKPAGGSYAFLSYMPANSTGFTDTSAAPGSTYQYAIRAIDGALGSPFTPEVSVTTGTVAPVAAPSGLSA